MASSGEGQRVVAAHAASRMTIGLRGEFGSDAAGTLRDVAAAAIDADKDLVVDMIDVTAIGPEGLAALDAVGVLARTSTGDGSLLVRPPMTTRDLYDAVVAVGASSFEVALLDDPPARTGEDRRRGKGER